MLLANALKKTQIIHKKQIEELVNPAVAVETE